MSAPRRRSDGSQPSCTVQPPQPELNIARVPGRIPSTPGAHTHGSHGASPPSPPTDPGSPSTTPVPLPVTREPVITGRASHAAMPTAAPVTSASAMTAPGLRIVADGAQAPSSDAPNDTPT